MATLNLSFDTGSVTLNELNDGLAIEWGYSATLPDGTPNPQTKAQFNKAQIRRIIKEAYRNGKRAIILAQAEATVPDIEVT